MTLRRAIETGALLLLALGLGACGDQMVTLQYGADPRIERLPSGQAITVFRFVDARGSEGDDGDPTRVGGVYGGYGNRLAKVTSHNPWPEFLVHSLAAGFSQRGIQAVAVPDKVYTSTGASVSTPLAIGGEIRNFSTETRWTMQAHVSGVVRLHNQQGRLLLEKPASARVRESAANTHEALRNEAVTQFVRAIVTDPELTQRLVAAR